MSRFVIFVCLLVIAIALANDGQEPSHDEGSKHPKMPDSELPMQHNLPKMSSPPKTLENKAPPKTPEDKVPPKMSGNNQQKN